MGLELERSLKKSRAMDPRILSRQKVSGAGGGGITEQEGEETTNEEARRRKAEKR